MRTLLLFASFCSSDILGFYVGVMTNPPKACRTKSRGFHAGYQRRLAPRKHGCSETEGKPWYALEGLNCAQAPLGGCTRREGRGGSASSHFHCCPPAYIRLPLPLPLLAAAQPRASHRMLQTHADKRISTARICTTALPFAQKRVVASGLH